MSQVTHYETAPEDRISLAHKLIYGMGAFVNNILAAAIGGMVIVLNLGFGMSPALVGLLGALPRLTDAVTDPLMGYISDKTRSRWGRRRPYIFVGAILAAVIFALLWQLPRDQSETFYFWYFLAGSLIFYLAYTMFATPWVALGYEMTPDYNERTRLMGVQNVIGNIAYLISPYFLAIMYNKTLFDDAKDGAAGLAIIIAIAVVTIGVLPAIFLRERFTDNADAGDSSDGNAECDRLAASLANQPHNEVDAALLRTFAGSEAEYYVWNWRDDNSAAPELDAAPFAASSFNWSAFLLSALWLVYRKLWSTLALFLPVTGAIAYVAHTAVSSYTAGQELPETTAFLVNALKWTIIALPALGLGFVANRHYLTKARSAIGKAIGSATITGAGLQTLAESGGTIFRKVPGIESFFSGFATTIRFAPFRKLCVATFLVFNGFILIAAFQSYVIIYYVFGGDAEAGSSFVGHSGLLQGLAALVVIVIVTWIATKIGKRRAFYVSTGISMIGYALKWFCYTPDNPWLVLIPAPLMAFGLAGLFTLMPSMIADVVDEDELYTRERREGMYGSIFWWVVKLGQAVAIFGGGLMLVWTGFDVDLGGNQAASTITQMRLFDAFVPCMASGVAIWAVASYSITEEKARETREKLEQRRGSPDIPEAAAPA